jgi:hypothetical protein
MQGFKSPSQNGRNNIPAFCAIVLKCIEREQTHVLLYIKQFKFYIESEVSLLYKLYKESGLCNKSPFESMVTPFVMTRNPEVEL